MTYSADVALLATQTASGITLIQPAVPVLLIVSLVTAEAIGECWAHATDFEKLVELVHRENVLFWSVVRPRRIWWLAHVGVQSRKQLYAVMDQAGH